MRSAVSANHAAHMLGGGATPIDLSLVAARASAAVRRAAAGNPLDARDRAVLIEVGDLLLDAAGVVEFFGSDGREGSPGAAALAAQVDATIDAAMGAQTPGSEAGETGAIGPWLRSKAQQVQGASTLPSSEVALTLAGFLDELSVIALRQTAQAGELTSTL